MSSIYNLEPPTTGKVLVSTSLGALDVELWSKHAPLACRLFLQCCLDGSYSDSHFHRVIKGFSIQFGAKEPRRAQSDIQKFKVERSSRLKFSHRGIVALAASTTDEERDLDLSQVFITLAATPELNGQHTIFGKVTGDSLYNALRIGEVDVEQEDCPVEQVRILGTEIVVNPFPEMSPKVAEATELKVEEEEKFAPKQVKNLKLLSFAEEVDDDDEIEEDITFQTSSGTSKSVERTSQDKTEESSFKMPPQDKSRNRKFDREKPIEITEDEESGSLQETPDLKNAVQQEESSAVFLPASQSYDELKAQLRSNVLHETKRKLSDAKESPSLDYDYMKQRKEQLKRFHNKRHVLFDKKKRQKDTMEKLESFQKQLRSSTSGKGSAPSSEKDHDDDDDEPVIEWASSKLSHKILH